MGIIITLQALLQPSRSPWTWSLPIVVAVVIVKQSCVEVEVVTRTHDTSKKSISEETACRVPYTSLYDALHFRDAVDGQNLKAKNDISTPNNNSEEEEEHGNFQQRPNDLPTVSTEYHTSLTKISVSYHALHGVSSIGLRFDAIYSPGGFSVPSTLVPISQK